MPQGPIQSVSLTPTQSKLNITAAAVVKATPGRISKIVVVAPGTTSGNLTVNDSATVAGASAANTILDTPFSDLTAGQVIDLGNWPCVNGIVISAVPGAGSPIFAVSYS